MCLHILGYQWQMYVVYVNVHMSLLVCMQALYIDKDATEGSSVKPVKYFMHTLIINIFLYLTLWGDAMKTNVSGSVPQVNITFVKMQITKNPAVQQNLAKTPFDRTGIRIWLNHCK